MHAPDLAANAGRVRNRDRVGAGLRSIFAQHPVSHWLALLRQADVPAAPIQDLATAARDPQLAARGMLRQSATAAGLPFIQVANPLLRAATPAFPPPGLGEGGEELARLWLEPETPENFR
jgi:crotonobetainyl-CoA:carnitine CoA-transferase CaiB-like acyl-CoA transferase